MTGNVPTKSCIVFVYECIAIQVQVENIMYYGVKNENGIIKDEPCLRTSEFGFLLSYPSFINTNSLTQYLIFLL
jgi:hypothetical protein